MNKFVLGILMLMFALPASAEKLALVGGRLIDGYVGTPLLRSVILINGDTIEKIGTVDSLPVPDEYRQIELWGHDVMPGLWENHAHLQLVGHADYIHWQDQYDDKFVSEIMPAAAVQLLLAGVTSARDLGASLPDSVDMKALLESGEVPGPTVYFSGPFLQHDIEDWQQNYRWKVRSADEARARVEQLHEAGMDIVKLIEHDDMEPEVAQTIVDEAHQRGMKVVAHAHRPDEIRRGLELGVDNFEHTGLTTAPGYPQDILDALAERTATGIFDGLLFWTPTIEGLWNYQHTVENPTTLDNQCWHRGLEQSTVDDIQQSIREPSQLGYTQLTPLRRSTLKNKFSQLQEAGVVMLVGTDSGIPMKFHCQSTWKEMAWWVEEMDVDPLETIRAATYWPAVMMGVEDKYGTLSAGKKADIIAVEGDVLRYINLLQRVDFVMKDGVVYKEQGAVNTSVLPERFH